MKNLLFGVLALFLGACSTNDDDSDAFGNFESNEVIVSSEINGTIVKTAFHEGEKVNTGDILAVVDTGNLVLQRIHLLSQKKSILAQKEGLYAQIAVSEQQIKNIEVDRIRLKKMFEEGAATQKQLDDIEGQIALIDKQEKAYSAQISAIEENAEAVDAQIDVLNDRINSALIISPISGVILEKYCETGELAPTGKPVYKIANLDTLILRVYVSGNQLERVKIGSSVKVRIDSTDSIKELSGTVEWIASEAEFTPKIIQTREERVKLVYAVKIRVPNNGLLKIGMPAEVKF